MSDWLRYAIIFSPLLLLTLALFIHTILLLLGICEVDNSD